MPPKFDPSEVKVGELELVCVYVCRMLPFELYKNLQRLVFVFSVSEMCWRRSRCNILIGPKNWSPWSCK